MYEKTQIKSATTESSAKYSALKNKHKSEKVNK